MILECNFTVFICEISGNDLRSLIEFRVKIRFSDTMTKMDRRDDKQIKVLRCIEPCFTDHLIQTSGDHTGGCTIAGLAVVRSEHDDHEIERIVHFHSDTDHIQPPAALAELILKDSSPAAKSFLYNMIFWTKLLLKKSSPSCIFIKASGLIRLVSPGIRIAKA